MADEPFKLPAASLEQVFRIVQGYAEKPAGASLSEVSQTTGIPTSEVSRNSGFLRSIGIIEGTTKRALTPVGNNLALALSNGLEEQVSQSLAQVIEGNEFLQKMVSAIRIRGGMDKNTLQAHIAYSAGVKKSSKSTTGSLTVIEFLKAAGAVTDTDGKIVVDRQPQDSHQSSLRITEKSDGGRVRILRQSRRATPNLQINININCGAGDLKGLGPRLKEFMKDIEASLNSDDPDKTTN